MSRLKAIPLPALEKAYHRQMAARSAVAELTRQKVDESTPLPSTVLVHPETANLLASWPQLKPVVTETVAAEVDGRPVVWIREGGGDEWVQEVREG